jgi:hypothetical protein
MTDDREAGTGHPLPASGEARHNEIPEDIEREKGRGDDDPEVATPDEPAVNPNGEPYRYDDLGRGDGADRGTDIEREG